MVQTKIAGPGASFALPQRVLQTGVVLRIGVKYVRAKMTSRQLRFVQSKIQQFFSLPHTVTKSTPLHQKHARNAQHVSDDQGTSQKGAHDCATNAGEIPQRYLWRPGHSHNASDKGVPGQLGRVAVIGGSEKYVKMLGPLTLEESEQLTLEQLHRRPILFSHGIRTIRYKYTSGHPSLSLETDKLLQALISYLTPSSPPSSHAKSTSPTSSALLPPPT